MDSNLTANADKPTWFVLKHLDMPRFKKWLDAENVKRLEGDSAAIEPFYPYDYLRGRQATTIEEPFTETARKMLEKQYGRKHKLPTARTVAAETQNDFLDIVFLRGYKADIDSLVNDEWNKAFRVQLHYLLDPATKREAKVSERAMDQFYANCVKYRGRFEISPPISDIESKDRVEIKKGLFSGNEAYVVKVRHSRGELHLDLAVQLVSGVMNITMTDVKPHEVVLLDRDAVGAIRKDFIEYTQGKLLTVFEHRVKTVNDAQTRYKDLTTLNRLYRYHSYEVEGQVAKTHFKALMLICAHLRKDPPSEEALREECLSLLAFINSKSASKASTDTRTWLWIALYISTAAPAYRDAAKQYIRDHQPKSKQLCRFVRLMCKGKKV